MLTSRRPSPIFFIAFALALVLSTAALAAGGQEPLIVEADALSFSQDGLKVRASGHVRLRYQDVAIAADELLCDGGMVTASGHVGMTTRDSELSADQITFDLDRRILSASNLRGRLSGIVISALSAVPGAGPGEQSFVEAGLTRCGFDNPCYELLAGRITIRGRQVEIERGWLALKGIKLLPLPRLRLDLDRLEDWPRLSLGYDGAGLYMGASMAVPVAERTDLLLSGETHVGDPFSIRLTLDRRIAKADLRPWFAYSRAGGYRGGMDVQTGGGWLASISASSISPAGGERYDLRLSMPPWRLGLRNGTTSLSVFYTWERKPSDSPEPSFGVELNWSGQSSQAARTEFGLTAGWRPEAHEPLLRVSTDISRRLNESWGLDLAMDYDPLGGEWRTGSFAIVRYLHCYYVRLNYGWTDGRVGITGGLTF